MRKFL